MAKRAVMLERHDGPDADAPRCWRREPGGIALAVKVRPGAKRQLLGPVQPAAERPGWPRGRLAVAVTAPAEGGAANEAVIGLLAGRLGLPRTAIAIRAGKTSRDKLIGIVAETAALARALAALDSEACA
ncbi:MAG: DUF167 domain-containing protein [Rhodospirillales bacterium]|nr:DUF167 domain-containing protein [Rhodospirillales bacterium]